MHSIRLTHKLRRNSTHHTVKRPYTPTQQYNMPSSNSSNQRTTHRKCHPSQNSRTCLFLAARHRTLCLHQSAKASCPSNNTTLHQCSPQSIHNLNHTCQHNLCRLHHTIRLLPSKHTRRLRLLNSSRHSNNNRQCTTGTIREGLIL